MAKVTRKIEGPVMQGKRPYMMCPNYRKSIYPSRKDLCDRWGSMDRVYRRKSVDGKQRYVPVGWLCDGCHLFLRDDELRSSKPGP